MRWIVVSAIVDITHPVLASGMLVMHKSLIGPISEKASLFKQGYSKSYPCENCAYWAYGKVFQVGLKCRLPIESSLY